MYMILRKVWNGWFWKKKKLWFKRKNTYPPSISMLVNGKIRRYPFITIFRKTYIIFSSFFSGRTTKGLWTPPPPPYRGSKPFLEYFFIAWKWSKKDRKCIKKFQSKNLFGQNLHDVKLDGMCTQCTLYSSFVLMFCCFLSE